MTKDKCTTHLHDVDGVNVRVPHLYEPLQRGAVVEQRLVPRHQQHRLRVRVEGQRVLVTQHAPHPHTLLLWILALMVSCSLPRISCPSLRSEGSETSTS